MCNRRVINPSKGLPCHHCQSFIHKKCCRLPNWQSHDIRAILKNWYCSSCCENLFPFNSLNNFELIAEGFNSNETCPCTTLTHELNELELTQTISELDFNRLELNDAHPNSNNDIHENVNLKCNFKYYSTHEFHKLQNKLKAFKHIPFSLIHTNICSVNKNLNNLEILQTTLGHNFDVIALSETWITKENEATTKNLHLTGYQKYHGTAGNSLKGGCGFLVSEGITFIPREDLDYSFVGKDCEFEANWIEITTSSKSSYVIGVVYRHPRKKQEDKFIDYLTNTVLRKIRKENKTVFITGDFNINLLQYDIDTYTDNFLNLLLSNFFQPHIIQPSKIVTNHKPTLIDNIFLNSIEFNTFSGNLTSTITDHMPNFIFCQNLNVRSSKGTKSVYRDYSNFNAHSYICDLRKVDLTNMTNAENDPDEKFNIFQDSLLNIINKHVDA